MHPPIAEVLLDLLTRFGAPSAALVDGAYYTMAAGVVMALVASLPGFADWSSIRRDHPARREIRDLVVHLDPHTGDVDQLDLVEAGGDKVGITFSQRRRDAGEDEIAALLQPT